MARFANEKTGPKLKRGPSEDFVVTKGDVLTPVEAFFGDITGTPPRVAAYRDPEAQVSKTSMRRPSGARKGGGEIDSVTIKKGKGY